MVRENNVETLPNDVIIVIMKHLLGVGFESFFNFFISWARSQRPATISSLLLEFPVCTLWKFGIGGTVADRVCFDRFFSIAERLGNADARFYQRCISILRGSGSIQVHLQVLNGLAHEGHFLSMIGYTSLCYVYQVESAANTLMGLSLIFSHPYYNNQIIPALGAIRAVKAGIGGTEAGHERDFENGCPGHGAGLVQFKAVGPMTSEECAICRIVEILNVFRMC